VAGSGVVGDGEGVGGSALSHYGEKSDDGNDFAAGRMGKALGGPEVGNVNAIEE
jgi:hypothetical protein